MNLFLEEWTSWMMSPYKVSLFFSRKPAGHTHTHTPACFQSSWSWSMLVTILKSSQILFPDLLNTLTCTHNIRHWLNSSVILFNHSVTGSAACMSWLQVCYWSEHSWSCRTLNNSDLLFRSKPLQQSAGCRTESRGCSSEGCSLCWVCAESSACSAWCCRCPAGDTDV